MTKRPLRIAVFASGGGSNFQSIVDAVADGSLSASVALCVTNNRRAGVLARAARHATPTAVLDPAQFASEETYTDALLHELQAHAVDLIALAGYLRMIPPAVVRAFHHRIVNIHPSLLPAFGGHGMYGRRVHEAVLAYGVRWSGVTVHLVDEAYDTGPIVLQEPVPVELDDLPETLAARVLRAEHKLYPQALQLFAEDRILVEGRRVIVRPVSKASADKDSIYNDIR